MQTERLRNAFLVVTCCITCCLSISTAVVADPPRPVKIPAQPLVAPALQSSVDLIANDEPGTVAQELSALKALVKKLDQRIRRLETMLEYDRAVRTRAQALAAWREVHDQRGTLADFAERDAQLRARYFETRTDVDLILQQLNEFYK